MIRKYAEYVVEDVQKNLGVYLEYCYYEFGIDCKRAFSHFINFGAFEHYETNRHYCSYYSGVELAHIIIKEFYPSTYQDKREDYDMYIPKKGNIYWAGWALAYFQWHSAISYYEINKYVSVEEIVDMYDEYHKKDLKEFCKKMINLIKERRKDTKFKYFVDLYKYSFEKISQETGFDVELLKGFYDGSQLINNLPTYKFIELANYFKADTEDLYEYIDDYVVEAD